MHLEFRWDQESSVILASMAGEFSPRELVESFIAFMQLESLAADSNVLWDLRRLDFSSVSTDRLDEFFDLRAGIEPLRTGSRAAFVVNGKMEEILMRVVEARSQYFDQEQRIFTDFDDAKDWFLLAN